MTTPDRTLTHWPDWMRTAGALLRSNSLVRSHCRVCGALLRIDLASLVARHGADWNLIDRRERCAMVGCAGSSVYPPSWTYRPACHVLSSADRGSATVAATGRDDGRRTGNECRRTS